MDRAMDKPRKQRGLKRGSLAWRILQLVNERQEGLTTGEMSELLRLDSHTVSRRASHLVAQGLISASKYRPCVYKKVGASFDVPTLEQQDAAENTVAAKVRNVLRRYAELDTTEIASQLNSTIHAVGYALRDCRKLGVADSRLDDGKYLWRMTDGSSGKAKMITARKEQPKEIAARQRMNWAIPVKTHIRKDGVKVTTCETGVDYRFTVKTPEKFFQEGKRVAGASWVDGYLGS